MFGKRNAAALVAEFLGTGVLTLLVFSVQRSTIGVPFFIAIAAGLAVVVMSFAVGKTSGGYFNPALVVGLWTARKIPTVKAIGFIAVQFLGAWAAYALYKYMTKGTLQNIGGVFSGRILLAETLGTAVFAFGFASAIYQRFTLAAAASVAGLSLTLGIIAASSASLGILNPAVAFGVRAWLPAAYVLGPILGAVIGVNLYSLLFATKDEILATETTVVKPAKVVTAKKVVAKKTTKKTATKKK